MICSSHTNQKWQSNVMTTETFVLIRCLGSYITKHVRYCIVMMAHGRINISPITNHVRYLHRNAFVPDILESSIYIYIYIYI